MDKSLAQAREADEQAQRRYRHARQELDRAWDAYDRAPSGTTRGEVEYRAGLLLRRTDDAQAATTALREAEAGGR